MKTMLVLPHDVEPERQVGGVFFFFFFFFFTHFFLQLKRGRIFGPRDHACSDADVRCIWEPQQQNDWVGGSSKRARERLSAEAGPPSEVEAVWKEGSAKRETRSAQIFVRGEKRTMILDVVLESATVLDVKHMLSAKVITLCLLICGLLSFFLLS
jgi:hypothetical protein